MWFADKCNNPCISCVLLQLSPISTEQSDSICPDIELRLTGEHFVCSCQFLHQNQLYLFFYFFLTSHKWVWVAYAGGWVSLPHSLSVSIFQSCISCGGRWTHYMFIHSNGNVISSIFAAFIIFRPYSIPASMETRACTLHPSLPLSQPCRLHQSPAPLPLWLLHRCP